MQESFWLNMWLNNDIGFHQAEYNPMLENLWEELVGESTEDVLVPLCGKTLDMKYLADKGHKVYGVEISRLAVESFFTEQKIKPKKEKELYYSDNYSLYCTDILRLDPENFKKVHFIYDRASFVALPNDMREEYVKWLKQIGQNTKVLLISFDFGNDEVGPPFSIPESKIHEYFEDTFTIEKKKEVEITGEDIPVHKEHVEYVKIQAYFLTKK